jgi:type II secretion system protein C
MLAAAGVYLSTVAAFTLILLNVTEPKACECAHSQVQEAVAVPVVPEAKPEPEPRQERQLSDAELRDLWASECRSSSTWQAKPAHSGLIRLTENCYEVKEELVDSLLAKGPNYVARGARVVPSIRDGEVVGFKLYAMRPSAVLSWIGLQNGDTVVAVNGLSLGSLDVALDVYEAVREAKVLRIELIRRGKPYSLMIRKPAM